MIQINIKNIWKLFLLLLLLPAILTVYLIVLKAEISRVSAQDNDVSTYTKGPAVPGKNQFIYTLTPKSIGKYRLIIKGPSIAEKVIVSRGDQSYTGNATQIVTWEQEFTQADIDQAFVWSVDVYIPEDFKPSDTTVAKMTISARAIKLKEDGTVATEKEVAKIENDLLPVDQAPFIKMIAIKRIQTNGIAKEIDASNKDNANRVYPGDEIDFSLEWSNLTGITIPKLVLELKYSAQAELVSAEPITHPSPLLPANKLIEPIIDIKNHTIRWELTDVSAPKIPIKGYFKLKFTQIDPLFRQVGVFSRTIFVYEESDKPPIKRLVGEKLTEWDVWQYLQGKVYKTKFAAEDWKPLPFAAVGVIASGDVAKVSEPLIDGLARGEDKFETDEKGEFLFEFNRRENFASKKETNLQYEIALDNEQVYFTDVGGKDEDTLFFRTMPEALSDQPFQKVEIKMSYEGGKDVKTRAELLSDDQPTQEVTNTSSPEWEYPTYPEAIREVLIGTDIFANITVAKNYFKNDLALELEKTKIVITPPGSLEKVPWTYALSTNGKLDGLYLSAYHTLLPASKRYSQSEYHELGHQIFNKIAGSGFVQWDELNIITHEIKQPKDQFIYNHSQYSNDSSLDSVSEGFANFIEIYLEKRYHNSEPWFNSYSNYHFDWVYPIVGKLFNNHFIVAAADHSQNEEFSMTSFFKGLVVGHTKGTSFPWINSTLWPENSNQLQILPLATDETEAMSKLFDLLREISQIKGSNGPSLKDILFVLALKDLNRDLEKVNLNDIIWQLNLKTASQGNIFDSDLLTQDNVSNADALAIWQYFNEYTDDKPKYNRWQAAALRFGIFFDQNCNFRYDGPEESIGLPAHNSGFIYKQFLSALDKTIPNYPFDLSYKIDEISWPKAIAQQKNWQFADGSRGLIERYVSSAYPRKRSAETTKNNLIGPRRWRNAPPPPTGSVISFELEKDSQVASPYGQKVNIKFEFAPPYEEMNYQYQRELLEDGLLNLQVPPPTYPGRVLLWIEGSSTEPIAIDFRDYDDLYTTTDQPPSLLAQETFELDGGTPILPEPEFRTTETDARLEIDYSQVPLTANATVEVETTTEEPTVKAGETVTLSLDNFNKAQDIKITVDGELITEQRILGDSVINISLPADLISGDHKLEILGSDGKRAESLIKTTASDQAQERLQTLIAITVAALMLIVLVIFYPHLRKRLILASLLLLITAAPRVAADVTPEYRQDFMRLPESSFYGRKATTLDEYNELWGTVKTNCFIQRLAFEWNHKYPDDPQWLIINDISRPQGGSFPPHNFHQAGKSIDVIPVDFPRTNNPRLAYDAEKKWPNIAYSKKERQIIQSNIYWQKVYQYQGKFYPYSRDFINHPYDNPFPLSRSNPQGIAISQILSDLPSLPFYNQELAVSFAQTIRGVASVMFGNTYAKRITIYFDPPTGYEVPDTTRSANKDHRDHWHIELP